MNNIKFIIFSMKEIIITYILQYLLIFILCGIYTLLGYKDLTHFINNYCIILLLIYYLITITYLLKNNKIKEPTFKFSFKNIYPLVSVGIAIAVVLNIIIFKLINNTNVRNISLPIALVSSGIIGPIYEEIVFRYIFLNRLKKQYSTKKSILINTIMFAIIHQNPIQMLYAFILGLIINLSYYKYKNIIAPIITHISANIIVLFISSFNIYLLLLSILLLLINANFYLKNPKVLKLLTKKL